MKMKISKSFLHGYEKAWDLSGATKVWPEINDDQKRDYEALRGDWESVGKSINRGIKEYSRLCS